MSYRAASPSPHVTRMPSGDVLWAIFRRSDGKRLGQVYAASFVQARELAEARTGLTRDEINLLWIREGSA